jgi:hypothetical protein
MALRFLAPALAVFFSLAPALAVAQSAGTRYTPLVVGWERYFTVTVEGSAPGRVAGWISNEWGFPARRIQLLVEGLDAAGQVTGQRVAWLGHDLAPGARAFFQAPAPPGTSHRVSVFAFDWVQAASLSAP